MPTTGTKQQQKVKSLIEGKKIMNDASSFLKEILSLAEIGTTTRILRDMKKLPGKNKLLMKGVDQDHDEFARSEKIKNKKPFPLKNFF